MYYEFSFKTPSLPISEESKNLIFRMSVELCLFGVGIEATLKNEQALYHEIWLAESLKAAWATWSSLGWDENTAETTRIEEWTNLELKDSSARIIDKISHFLRAVTVPDFNIRQSFKMGWSYILQTVDVIIQHDLHLEACDQVDSFRFFVAKFIAYGISEGLTCKTSAFRDSFLDTVREHINYDYMGPTDLEITFSQAQTETTVTVLSPKHNVNILNCDCTVVHAE